MPRRGKRTSRAILYLKRVAVSSRTFSQPQLQARPQIRTILQRTAMQRRGAIWIITSATWTACIELYKACFPLIVQYLVLLILLASNSRRKSSEEHQTRHDVMDARMLEWLGELTLVAWFCVFYCFCLLLSRCVVELLHDCRHHHRDHLRNHHHHPKTLALLHAYARYETGLVFE